MSPENDAGVSPRGIMEESTYAASIDSVCEGGGCARVIAPTHVGPTRATNSLARSKCELRLLIIGRSREARAPSRRGAGLGK